LNISSSQQGPDFRRNNVLPGSGGAQRLMAQKRNRKKAAVSAAA